MRRLGLLIIWYIFLASFVVSSHIIQRRSPQDEDLLEYLGDSPRDQLAKVVIERAKHKQEGKAFDGEKRVGFLDKMGNYLRQDLGVDTEVENWLDMARNKARGISNKKSIKEMYF